MLMEISNMMPFIIPFGIILLAILIGLLFQRILLSRLEKVAARTKWKSDEIIIGSLKGVIVFMAFHSRCLHRPAICVFI